MWAFSLGLCSNLLGNLAHREDCSSQEEPQLESSLCVGGQALIDMTSCIVSVVNQNVCALSFAGQRYTGLDRKMASWSCHKDLQASFKTFVFSAAFVAETDDELSVAPGDFIVIQAEIDGWYQVTRLSDGARGLIPASYAVTT